jgi:hypothetical protein
MNQTFSLEIVAFLDQVRRGGRVERLTETTSRRLQLANARGERAIYVTHIALFNQLLAYFLRMSRMHGGHQKLFARSSPDELPYFYYG